MSYLVRVWDAPTRLYHWVLVVCVVGLMITSQIGGTAMEWHFRFGYSVLALLLFRSIWGLVGGHWSRFRSFIYRPSQIVHYLQGRSEPVQTVGHNPLGALSIFAMLIFLTLQVATGLFSDDEIAAAGPLARLVSSSWVGNATFYHRNVGKLVLLALVAMHLLAIGFYFFKKHQNLVRPMISGDKQLDFCADSAIDDRSSRFKAGLIAVLCATLVGGLVRWIG